MLSPLQVIPARDSQRSLRTQSLVSSHELGVEKRVGKESRTKKANALRGGGKFALIWTFQRRDDRFMWIIQRNDGAVKRTEGMDTKRSEVLQGTLDLMILKTLQALGPLHGFGTARRIEQVSRDVLQL